MGGWRWVGGSVHLVVGGWGVGGGGRGSAAAPLTLACALLAPSSLSQKVKAITPKLRTKMTTPEVELTE